MNAIKQAPEREDIEALLPWHAAGTLNRRDTQRVEQALAADKDLARQYEAVREELAETIRLNESLGAPSARAMEKLFTAIDAEAPRRARSPGLTVRFAEFLAGFSPRGLALASGAAALAIVLQAGVIAGVVIKDRGATFDAASHGQTAALSGSFALVRFAPEATAADITRFLETNKFTVVDGPKPGGMFKVKVADASVSKEEVDRIMARIQADRLVGSVLPSTP
jgi:hypothetical protein